MVDLVGILEFIRLHFVSLVFATLFICFIGFLLKLNFSNGPYKHFRISGLIARKDGSIDRKGFRETVLFFISIYGFLFFLQKHPDLLTNYFWTMAIIWLGAHIAADKLPNLGGPPKPPEKPGA